MVSIKELMKLAGPSAECAGGNVTAIVDGKRTLLGGPLGSTNVFELTPEGQAVVVSAKAAAVAEVVAEAAQPAKRGLKPKKVEVPAETPPAPEAPAGDDLGDLQL